jgi:glyoxylase-like metal-dependent hydrolase (beta-lactamase superfamily II)
MSSISSSPHAPIEYAYDDHPEYGSAREILPGVHWLRMPLPFRLDHINLWLLEDGGGWTVIDTGFNSKESRAHWEDLFTGYMQGRPVDRLICTHYHPDHMGLAGWLMERLGIEMWTTQGEFDTLTRISRGIGKKGGDFDPEFYRRAGCGPDILDTVVRRVDNFGKRFLPLPPSYRRVVDGEEIEIGGRRWKVIVGRGHSPELAALYCAELGALISGDQILPRITPNVGVHSGDASANPLGDFMASFDKFRALPEDTLVLPSHIRPFRGLHRRLDEFQEHHVDRLEVALTACDGEPLTAVEMLGKIFNGTYDSHQTFLALGETLAHLYLLEEQGRVERVTGDDGVESYVAAPGAVAKPHAPPDRSHPDFQEV